MMHTTREHNNFTYVQQNGIQQQLDAQEQVEWLDARQNEV
jgi:hypothetical protein